VLPQVLCGAVALSLILAERGHEESTRRKYGISRCSATSFRGLADLSLAVDKAESARARRVQPNLDTGADEDFLLRLIQH
jgi:hypothetical protein